MPKFSNRSKDKLLTCDQKLQNICNLVINYLDISVISGRRTALEQDSLYERGLSQVRFPLSKHNLSPSMAIDIMLWNKEKPHLRWNDREQMALVAGYMLMAASHLGYKLRWGGDFNGNLDTHDNWWDGAHFELVED